MADAKPANEDVYASWRTFADSPRLALQQYLWREHLGWNVHPSVSYQDDAEVKIAEIAAGTCLWLLQVSRELPLSAQLIGSDISLAQSPPASVLPRNVSIQTWNVFEPVPKEWIGYFDLVHVRLLYPGLGAGATSDSGTKASPVEEARKLMEMLKPGGYFQWDEYDLETRLINHLEPGRNKDVLEAAKSLYSGICRAIGGDHPPWTAKLDHVFAKIGLQDIEVDDKPFEPMWFRFWHEQEMLFCTQIIDVIAARNKGMAESLHQLQGIVQNAKYQGKGYVNNMRPVVVVGRKPIQQT